MATRDGVEPPASRSSMNPSCTLPRRSLILAASDIFRRVFSLNFLKSGIAANVYTTVSKILDCKYGHTTKHLGAFRLTVVPAKLT